MVPVQMLEEDQGRKDSSARRKSKPKKKEGGTDGTPSTLLAGDDAKPLSGTLGDLEVSVHSTTPLDLVITCLQACRDM